MGKLKITVRPTLKKKGKLHKINEIKKAQQYEISMKCENGD
jgi:hypothetical protein